MAVKLFSERTTNEIIEAQRNKVSNKIENLSNEEIIANDLEILKDNIYQEFFIEPITIHEEDFSRRKIEQSKVKREINSFIPGYIYKGHNEIDSVLTEYHFPFDGNEELFGCKASVCLLTSYPETEVHNREVIIRINIPIDEVKHIEKEKVISNVKESLNKIKQSISYVNNDIIEFNSGLKLFIWKLLNNKKSKVEAFFNFAKMIEVPIEKKEYARKYIPMLRKIVPIAHEYDRSDFYSITDSDYRDILETIKHTASTFERTPGSYKSMLEEDLRNVLLAALNATYKGEATGEAFRNKGKTDICIERQSREAFVAECKIWKGAKEIDSAISQLDSYLTWRDCKTALIFFVRRKDFLTILKKAKEVLKSIEGMVRVNDNKYKNEFDCVFLSKSNIGQQISIRVMFFNLYSAE